MKNAPATLSEYEQQVWKTKQDETIVHYLAALSRAVTAPPEVRQRAAVDLRKIAEGATMHRASVHAAAARALGAEPKKNNAAARAKPVAPTKKEQTTMKTAPKKTDAQITAEAIAHAERVVATTGDPAAREQARAVIAILDPKRGEACAELDRKMGLPAARSLAVQSGARHGMRAGSRAEIEAEIARRGGAR